MKNLRKLAVNPYTHSRARTLNKIGMIWRQNWLQTMSISQNNILKVADILKIKPSFDNLNKKNRDFVKFSQNPLFLELLAGLEPATC